MSPASAARRPVSGAARGGAAGAPRPGLRVVDQRRPGRRARHRAVPLLAVGVLVASLLVVVIGHAVLAEGQVRLSAAQTTLSTAQATHRQSVLSVAALETPRRIAEDAQGALHMVAPGQVHQLPYVPLDVPLRPPALAPGPAPAASSSTTATTQPGR